MSKSIKPLTGTNNWTKVGMKLQILENCEDLIVRIRWFKSDKFISGTTWIDDVRLIDLGNS